MRDITLEETCYFNFTTRAFSSGVPTVLSGTPALSVLESNNATPITSGVSVSVDRASVVGLNQATVVATAANGYEAGKSYCVYISTGTVGGVSVVGEVVAQFTVQSGAAFTRLGAPAGASVSADIAAIEAQTDDIGAAGAGLTAVPWNAAWDAEVQSEVNDGLVAYNAASTTNITSGTITTTTNLTNLPAITANWLTAAGIAADAITDAKVAADVTIASVTGAVGSVTGNVGGNVTGSVGSVAAGGIAAASFAAGAIDAAAIATGAVDADALAADAVTEIWAKALTELGAVPGVTASALDALNWVFTVARNKIEQTSSTSTLKKDDGTTTLATSAVSDDATTFTRGEWA